MQKKTADLVGEDGIGDDDYDDGDVQEPRGITSAQRVENGI